MLFQKGPAVLVAQKQAGLGEKVRTLQLVQEILIHSLIHSAYVEMDTIQTLLFMCVHARVLGVVGFVSN